MNKNTIIAILGTLVGVFVVLLIVGLSLPEEYSVDYSVDTGSEMHDGFVEGCMEEGTSYGLCSCMYDSIIDDYGKAGFLEIAYDFEETGELPESIYDSIATCF